MSGKQDVTAIKAKARKEIERTLSLLQKENDEKVVAITCGDLHLSHEPPLVRSNEPDWYEAMARPLIELREVIDKVPGVPVVYTGDIFDNGWKENKVPPQLINFALEYLPRGYGIPGQHDLPHHRLDDITKSAFWTLVKAGKIVYLDPGHVYVYEPNPVVAMTGFPWGTEVKPIQSKPDSVYTSAWDKAVKLAVVHAYCWMGNHTYPGAPPDQNVDYWNGLLKGYDAAVFGDNHNGFTYYNHSMGRKGAIRNGGTFMIRKSDEINYLPTIGLLTNQRRWLNYHLDKSLDSYTVTHPINKEGDEIDAEKVIEHLMELGETTYDFYEVMKRVAMKQNESVRSVIIRALGRTYGK